MRLNNYHRTHPTLHRSQSTKSTSHEKSLYRSLLAHSAFTALPPLPFLVPAVLEALQRSSKYCGITKVVPEEADMYCSKYLKQHGGIVLTGDSDFLVHDLGLEGAVSFLKDIQASPESETREMSTVIYRPVQITKQMALPNPHGLHSLAFEMVMDCHGTFRKLLAQAKALDAIRKHADLYGGFRREYDTSPGDSIEDLEVTKTVSFLQALDPRISEYVLQFPRLAEAAGQASAASSSDSSTYVIRVFLPFLLDCPVRTNAWEISTPIRQLAYGLINLIIPEAQQKFSVFEHKKQQDKSKGRELDLPAIEEVAGACMAVTALLVKMQERLPKLSKTDSWTAVAVFQDIKWSHSNSKPALSHLVIKQLADLENQLDHSKDFSWDIIQFFAQIQSSYYSFRILKQLTGLVIAYHDSIPEPIVQLQRQLDSLPELNQLNDFSQMLSILQQIKNAGVQSVVQDILGIVEQKTPATSKETGTAAKKKRKRDQTRLEANSSRGKPSNPFELLRVE